jgi:hypothetical protein
VKVPLLLEAPTRAASLIGAGDVGLAESSVIGLLLCERLKAFNQLIQDIVFPVKRFRDHLYVLISW